MAEDTATDLAIKVKMLFFGPLAERMGEREIEVALLQGSSVRDLMDRFRLTSLLDSGLRVAVNDEIGSDMDAPLADASEVAFLPPVSGG
jgi:molybdopterin converting factor small subunit